MRAMPMLHNQGACPKLALKLLRKVQDRHSIDFVASVMRDKSRPLAVQGIEVRYGSRKAVKKGCFPNHASGPVRRELVGSLVLRARG